MIHKTTCRTDTFLIFKHYFISWSRRPRQPFCLWFVPIYIISIAECQHDKSIILLLSSNSNALSYISWIFCRNAFQTVWLGSDILFFLPQAPHDILEEFCWNWRRFESLLSHTQLFISVPFIFSRTKISDHVLMVTEKHWLCCLIYIQGTTRLLVLRSHSLQKLPHRPKRDEGSTHAALQLLLVLPTRTATTVLPQDESQCSPKAKWTLPQPLAKTLTANGFPHCAAKVPLQSWLP